jgi:3',5'-cyclic AMP phosphodiesterase CpdA
MPVYIPPITRRQFLKGSLAAGTSLLLPRRLWADEKPADSNSWALLSDTHIAADRTKVAREVNLAEHFETAVREVIAMPQRPSAALITGDCAFLKGEKGDYTTFASLSQPIRSAQIPLHLVPGNHDDRSHLRGAFSEAKATRRPSADRCVAMVRSAHANWFLLDSLDQINGTPGVLGEAQLTWLAQTLDANPAKPAIIAAHHNPDNREKPSGLIDTAKLLEVILPRKQVKAYIFGHTHVWKVAQHDSGIHFINLPPTAYVFGKGMPSGWVLATLKPDGARLRLNCLDRAHAQHGQTFDLKWRA